MDVHLRIWIEGSTNMVMYFHWSYKQTEQKPMDW